MAVDGTATNANMSGVQTVLETRKSSCLFFLLPFCTHLPRPPCRSINRLKYSPKKDKYPYGYPGDAFGAKSIPHCRCHECYAKFPPGADNGTVCLKCSHKKCDNCARMKPQKVEPGPDPDVVKSVQEKIAAMNIS